MTSVGAARHSAGAGWADVAHAGVRGAVPADPAVVRTIERLRALALAAAGVVALLVLIGWIVDSGTLKEWSSAHPPMRTNAALGTLLLVIAFALLGRRPRVAQSIAVFTTAIAVLTGVELAAGVDLGIDQAIFSERSAEPLTTAANRMSPNAALVTGLLGLCVVLLRRRRRILWTIGHAAALSAFVVAMLGALGFASGAVALTGIGHSTYLSMPAAAALTLLAFAAVFSRMDIGFARAFTRTGFDGRVLRVSVAAAVVVPIGLGFARSALIRAGAASGTAEWLYTVAIVVILVGWALAATQPLGRALGAFTTTADRLRAIVAYSPLAVITFDETGNVTSWNPAAERLFGWSEAEVLGRPYPLADESTWEEISAELERAASGETLVGDRVRHRKDGSDVVVNVAAAPLRALDGAFAGVSVVLSDVTERRRAEEAVRVLNEELEQRVVARTAELTAANAELQAFSYSISHDLRTPLRALDGFSQALLEDYGPQLDDQARDYLGRIRGAAQRLAALIDDVLRLSRVTRAELSRQRVDVTSLARTIAAELASASPERAVRVAVADGLAADADPPLLRVVLQNLLENAWKFTATTAEPFVEVAAAQLDGKPGFAVSDNGAGFPGEHADKLFKPFQRLHSEAEYPGSGIGLATVKNIVNRHGGTIRAESRAGGGARFTFTLGDAVAHGPAPRQLAGVGTGGLT